MVNIRPFFYKYMSLQLTYLSGLDICEYVSECGACEYLPTNLESSYVYYLIVSKLHICNLLGPILAWYYFYIFHVVSLVSNSMLKLLYGAQGIGN